MWPLIAALSSIATAVTSWSWWRSPGARAARIAEAAVVDVRAEDDRLSEAVEAPRRRLEREAERWRERARRRRLEQLDVETLRDAGADRVRWAALREAGVTSVADVRDRSLAALTAVPGVGATSAARVVEAAERVEREVAASSPAPPAELADEHDEGLARAALEAVEVRALAGDLSERLGRRRDELDEAVAAARRPSRLAPWLGRRLRGRDDDEVARASRRVARDAFDVVEGELGDRARDVRARLAARRSTAAWSRDELADAWRTRRAAVVAALESSTPDAAPVEPAAGTRLPDEIVARVLALDFTPDGLSADLRRYQEFGARYLVVQERTLLGDDMGLGKTLQALAALCHLSATRDVTHGLAVVPATVVHNWLHEAERFTSLSTHLAHGARRGAAVDAWARGGGLLVTSYATLPTLALGERLERDGTSLALLVADEAHYVKNPEAVRTRALAALLPRAERACLMTGTPLENRLDEFAALLRLVRPDLPALADLDERALGWSVDPERLGVDVAEAYLRRNQRDVLVELPERIDVEHRVDLGADEREAYAEAVAEGHVMAMRRAVTIGAWRAGDDVDAELPAKLRRLVEIVDEARAAGRKTLVFSFFLDVLERVAAELDVFGTIRGDVSPAERQRLLAAFTAADGPAVLLGQITAAGVGLNLQAASVVVLMEPQWKPSVEEQAIARAHRMGQPDVVVAHRLIARDAIDERIDELLSDKLALFERYVSPSAVAAACDEATEPALARLVVDAERARLGVGASAAE